MDKKVQNDKKSSAIPRGILQDGVLGRQDRRKFRRLKKNILIEFRRADSLDVHKGSMTENVSLGGFMFEVVYVGLSPAIGDVMELMVKKDQNSQPIKALGKVTWFKRKDLSFKVQVGVQLIYIKPADEERMRKFLR